MPSAPKLRWSTKKILVHHSVTPQKEGKEAAIARIRRAHIANGLAYDGNPAYHVLLGHDWIALVRPENSVGYQSGNWTLNHTSIAICLIGNFNTDKLTAYQEEKLGKQLNEWLTKYKLSKADIMLHREVRPTACPGNNNTKPRVLALVDKWSKPPNPVLPRVNEAIRAAGADPAKKIDSGRTLSNFWQDWVNADKVNTYQELLDDIKGRIARKEYPHN